MRIIKGQLICLLTILTCSISSIAQPMDVIFDYDDSGNRVLREKLYLPEGASNTNDSLQTFMDETIISPSERDDAALSRIDGRTVYLYPNPTHGRVEVELGSFNVDTDSGDWFLTSVKGTVLLQSENLEKNLKLDLGKYPSGRYILKMNLNGQHKEWIIVKQ